MAKIKIKGFQELVTIPNKKAIEISRILKEKDSTDDIITLGDWTGKINQIAFVLTDVEIKGVVDTYKERLFEYYKHRDEILALTPLERAKKTSWSYFKFFYNGMYGKDPDESMKPSLFEHIATFYSTHPQWSKPSVMAFVKYLNIPNDSFNISENYLRIMERIESQEIRDANQDNEYSQKIKDSQINEDKVIQEAFPDDDIKVANLTF